MSSGATCPLQIWFAVQQKRLCWFGPGGSALNPCEHEYDELLDESGNSTHIWICKKCGRAKKTGLYAFDEPESAGEARRRPERRWVPDLVACTDILRAVARGNRDDKAIYDLVKGEIANSEELADYTQYLVGLGYLSGAGERNWQSVRRGYAITRSGREALASVSEWIDHALEAFPRETMAMKQRLTPPRMSVLQGEKRPPKAPTGRRGTRQKRTSPS